MLALKWPSNSLSHKKRTGLGLSFIEVKFGDIALVGAAGLVKHFTDVDSFLRKHPCAEICEEAQNMFNQKVELGLVCELNHATRIGIDQDKRIEFILLLANHKPASSILKRELKSILQSEIYKSLSEMVNIRIASSSLMGYGLYEKAMLSVEDYIDEN